MPGRDWLTNYRRIKYLVGQRFPGLTIKVADRWRELHEEADFAEPNFDIAQSLAKEFDLKLQDTFKLATWNLEQYSAHDVLSWLHAIEKYESELKAMPFSQTADIEEAYTASLVEDEWAELLSKDLNYFFAYRSAEADFERWLKIPLWSHEECVALSLRKNPRIVNRASLDAAVEKASPFLRDYNDRIDIVERAGRAGILKAEVPPADFVRWAVESRVFEIPAELSKLLVKGAPEEPPDGSESPVLYRMLLTAAVSKYGFDVKKTPMEQRSRVYAAIAKDAEVLGITLDRKTIKKHLLAAVRWAEEQGVAIKPLRR